MVDGTQKMLPVAIPHSYQETFNQEGSSSMRHSRPRHTFTGYGEFEGGSHRDNLCAPKENDKIFTENSEAGVGNDVLEMLSEEPGIRTLLSKLEVAIDALEVKWRQDSSGKWRPVIEGPNGTISEPSHYRPSPFSHRTIRRSTSSVGSSSRQQPVIRSLTSPEVLPSPSSISNVTQKLQTFHYGDDSDDEWAENIRRQAKRLACQLLLEKYRSGELVTLVADAKRSVGSESTLNTISKKGNVKVVGEKEDGFVMKQAKSFQDKVDDLVSPAKFDDSRNKSSTKPKPKLMIETNLSSPQRVLTEDDCPVKQATTTSSMKTEVSSITQERSLDLLSEFSTNDITKPDIPQDEVKGSETSNNVLESGADIGVKKNVSNAEVVTKAQQEENTQVAETEILPQSQDTQSDDKKNAGVTQDGEQDQKDVVKKKKVVKKVNLGEISTRTITKNVTTAAVSALTRFASWMPSLDVEEDPLLQACRDSSQY